MHMFMCVQHQYAYKVAQSYLIEYVGVNVDPVI